MSMIGLLLYFSGAFVYLFISWQKLKEDYISRQIFSISFYVILGIVLGLVLTRFSPLSSAWFWLAATGGFLGFFLGWWRFKMRFFELFEALSLGLIYWLAIIFLVDAIVNANVFSLFGFVVIGLLLFFFYFLEYRYRKFTWYKSGKVGFAGLMTLGTFFLIRSLVGLFWQNMLSFSGNRDPLISGLVALVLFLTLFKLSR